MKDFNMGVYVNCVVMRMRTLFHFLFRCSALKSIREDFMISINKILYEKEISHLFDLDKNLILQLVLDPSHPCTPLILQTPHISSPGQRPFQEGCAMPFIVKGVGCLAYLSRDCDNLTFQCKYSGGYSNYPASVHILRYTQIA